MIRGGAAPASAARASSRLALALGLALGGALAGCAPGARAAPGAAPPAEAEFWTAPEALVEPAPIERAQAPPPGPYAPGFDALHYDIRLTLPDTGAFIRGRAVVRVARTEPGRDTLVLDLTGLAVEAVAAGWAEPRAGGGTPAGIGRIPFRHEHGKLRIDVSGAGADTFGVSIFYAGVPDDGLIIGENVHGARGAFADNWPNRARFWFPSIDHPSDKATAEFRVRAPARWEIVANGVRADAGGEPAHVAPPALPPGMDPAGRGWTHWRTDVPIPTYLMVIGAAEMAVLPLGEACGVTASPAACVPLAAWAFPPDTAFAREVFARGPAMLRYYADLVGPFQYEKLDHIQSATMFGGMENASAIFYSDEAIAAGRLSEATVAHETAHQWFGDAVTEADWHHLWLSEGFATYFGALFFEHADGVERFRAMMRAHAQEYFGSDAVDRPVIDPDERDLLALLNANNYEKGGWVLHMLRGLLGDDAFFDGVRRYYAQHVNGTALTDDFRRALEAASGRELGDFFDQWLRRPGYPRLHVEWEWDAAAGAARVRVAQRQPARWPVFRTPLTLAFRTAAGERRATVELGQREQTFHVPLPEPPTSLAVDPDDWLLDQAVVRRAGEAGGAAAASLRSTQGCAVSAHPVDSAPASAHGSRLARFDRGR